MHQQSRPETSITSVVAMPGYFATAFKRWRSRRRTVRSLSQLDDRQLRDIGISQSEIIAIADKRATLSLTGKSERTSDEGLQRHPRSIALAMRLWQSNRGTKRDLRRIDRRLLVDLGYNPENINWLAADLAQRSTRRPNAANDDRRLSAA